MIASRRFPIGLSALLLCLAPSPSVLADGCLVPLDGSEKSIKPADFGYEIKVGRSGEDVMIHVLLNPEAARKFNHADLKLTSSANPAGRLEATLGLERDADEGGRIRLVFRSGMVDDGELILWSDPFEQLPVIDRFGGFRISVGTLLANLAKEPTEDEPGEREFPQAEMLPRGTIMRLGEKLALRHDPDDDERGPSPECPLAFSPDGSLLATGNSPALSWDRSVVLWDLKTGLELRRLHAGREVLMALAFSPDGQTLAWGGYGKVHLWDLATGSKRLQLETQEHTNIASLAFSADGNRIAAIGGKLIHLWDASTGQEIRRFSGDGGWARSVAVSSDGQTLAAAFDTSVHVWEIESGRERRQLPQAVANGRVRAVAFSPDGKLLLAVGDNRLQLWDTATWENRLTREFESAVFFSAAFAPDGKTFAACADFSARFWDTDSGREIFTFEPYGQASDFSAFAYSPNGMTFATVDDRGAVLVWDRERLPNYPPAISPDGLPVGRWEIEFANKVVESCEIRSDGTVAVAEPKRNSGGKVATEDGTIVIRFDDDRVERWTPVGRRMVVEHWYPAGEFQRAAPVLGIADLVLMDDGARPKPIDRVERPEAEGANLSVKVQTLEEENRTLRYQIRQRELRLLSYLDKRLQENPEDRTIRLEAAVIAAQLARHVPGNMIVWRVLLTTKTLKDGMTLADAEKLLGPPTSSSDTHVEWYYNQPGLHPDPLNSRLKRSFMAGARHVAPFLRAKVTDEGLYEWQLGRR
jgi:WD40 repeat protein